MHRLSRFIVTAVVVLLATLVGVSAHAQNHARIDSLKQVASNTSLPDTSRVRALVSLGATFTHSNLDTALTVLRQALVMARLTNDDTWQGKAKHRLAICFDLSGQLDSAQFYARQFDLARQPAGIYLLRLRTAEAQQVVRLAVQ